MDSSLRWLKLEVRRFIAFPVTPRPTANNPKRIEGSEKYIYRGSVNAAEAPTFATLRPRVCACVRVLWLLLSAAAASLFKCIQPSLSASCTGVREVEPNTKTAGLVCFAPPLTHNRAYITLDMSAEMRRCSTNAVRKRKVG